MSEMPGQRELLNICFSCLRYSRMTLGGLPLVCPISTSHAFLRGVTLCGHCPYSTGGREQGSGPEAKQTKSVELEDNPFYEKYKAKLQYLADANPDEFKQRVEQLQEENTPKRRPNPASASPGATRGERPRPAPQPIPRSASYTTEKIWKDYHSQKDCVFAVLQRDAFEDLMTKGQSCPTFIFPLPRNDGFEFVLMQFDGKDVQFTSLAMYQILKENSPACLSLVHYTELLDSKGIVLMSGQYDNNVLKREEALMIVQLMAIYYGKNSPRFDRVEMFNHQPDKFNHNLLIDEYKMMYSDTPKPVQ